MTEKGDHPLSLQSSRYFPRIRKTEKAVGMAKPNKGDSWQSWNRENGNLSQRFRQSKFIPNIRKFRK